MAATLVLSTAVAATGSAAAEPPRPSCDTGAPCVVVQVVDRQDVVAQRIFHDDEITGEQSDVINTSYPLSTGGADTITRGSSVRRLVDLTLRAGDVPTFAEVVGPDPIGRHLLTAQEIRAGSDNGFPGGLMPAFARVGDPATRFSYLRPQRSADDPNNEAGPDLGNFFGDLGGPLVVRVHLSGQILAVQATATPIDGSARSFLLSTDQPAGSSTFSWFLPDGSTPAEPTPTYVVPADALGGSYPAIVGVEAADGSFGWGQALVQIGPAPSAPPSPKPTRKPGTGGHGHASSGPTRNPSGGASGLPNPEPSGPPIVLPSLTPPATPIAPTPTTPASGPGPQPSPTVAPSPTPTAAPTPTTPAGEEVVGLLLTAGQVVEPAPATRASAPSAGAAPIVDEPVTVSRAAWAVAAVLLLLALGAAGEADLARRWRRRRMHG